MKKISMLCCAVFCCMGLQLFAQDSFFDDAAMETETGTQTDSLSGTGTNDSRKFEYSGAAQLGIRMYPEKNIQKMEAVPVFGINMKYNGSKTELEAHLKCDARTIDAHPLDLIDELTMRAYLGSFVLSAGKMKVVWGRGDMLHVLDPFNANDFTDFIIPDYIDRRIAEPMLHIAYNAPIPLRLEAVWTPVMTPDRFATKGVWVPSQLDTALIGYLSSMQLPPSLESNRAFMITNTKKVLEKIPQMLSNTYDIKYGQYGLRLSGSAGPVDMACQYYYGHYKTPSFDVQEIVAGNANNCAFYDPVHILGFDIGAVLGYCNLKSEFAYYMTEDFKGSDPAVHNNSVQWILGFDLDIPLNNLNVNVQNIGSYTLGFEHVKTKFDMDWNTAEKSTNNKLVCNISDSWLHGKLEDSLTVIWGIEHNDAVVIPRIKYKIKDDFYVEGSGAYIYAQHTKSAFSEWKNNHFIQLSFEYLF